MNSPRFSAELRRRIAIAPPSLLALVERDEAAMLLFFLGAAAATQS